MASVFPLIPHTVALVSFVTLEPPPSPVVCPCLSQPGHSLLSDGQVFCGLFLAKISLSFSRHWNNMNYSIGLREDCHFIIFVKNAVGREC